MKTAVPSPLSVNVYGGSGFPTVLSGVTNVDDTSMLNASVLGAASASLAVTLKLIT